PRVRADRVFKNAFNVAVADAQRQDAMQILFVRRLIEMHLQGANCLVLGASPWLAPVSRGDTGNDEHGMLPVKILQPEISVVASDVELEPLIEENRIRPQQLLNGLRNRAHKFALLSCEGERNQKHFWNFAWHCLGARLSDLVTGCQLFSEET